MSCEYGFGVQQTEVQGWLCLQGISYVTLANYSLFLNYSEIVSGVWKNEDYYKDQN